MAAALSGRIRYGSELVAVKKNSDGAYTLSFKQGTSTKTTTADKVVLALPFSILRSSADLSKAGFSQLKMTAISEQGMGTNSKLQPYQVRPATETRTAMQQNVMRYATASMAT